MIYLLAGSRYVALSVPSIVFGIVIGVGLALLIKWLRNHHISDLFGF